MPGDLVAEITTIPSKIIPSTTLAGEGSDTDKSLIGRFPQMTRGVVLWEWSRQTPSWAVDELIAISSTRPGVLQLVATLDLPIDQQIMLSELGVSGIMRNPEDLLRFSLLIRGHFDQAS